ncbi:hypothetical protein [Streptomyces blastmyceticus]|uniref:Uncharacterized protein n=1 Tax=Streptomyces blastmyceticus TaxID=68180 RepID=A0ABN0XWI0_9ACTN
MSFPRRSPADVGLQLWDLVERTGDAGMLREAALAHMSAHQFEIAKVWDRDTMCPLKGRCFLYALGRYFVSTNPDLSVLAVARELGLVHHKAVRLHTSAIEPLLAAKQTTAQLQVVHTALSDIIKATAPLRKAGFSADLAARLKTTK